MTKKQDKDYKEIARRYGKFANAHKLRELEIKIEKKKARDYIEQFDADCKCIGINPYKND